MNRSFALGLAAVTGLVGFGLLSRPRRERLQSQVACRMQGRLERILAHLPDNAPPKLVVEVLPRLREQNEQILQLLKEQNALLRARSAQAAE